MTSLASRTELLPQAPEVAGYHTNYILNFQHESGAASFAALGPTGVTPAQIRHAYGFDQISFGAGTIPGDGTGTTIAIVTAFDNPNIEKDLHQFSVQFGLPDPPSFSKVNQTGGSTLPMPNGVWARETALDVEWAHAIAPKANILLVEAATNSVANVSAAVAYAALQPGVVVVSMSFASDEFAGELANDSLYLTPIGHAGVTFVAASGDHGAPPSQPAISPNVLAVGGTALSLDAVGNILSESGWNGSGGGISVYETQPSYQAGVVTQSASMRTNPDVAYNSSPSAGFPIYDTFNNPVAAPWSQAGGTSAAAPQWAALIAIANQGRALAGLTPLDGRNDTLPKIYSLPSGDFYDIATGSSTGTPTYDAAPGYDLVTGRGTPKADRIVADLIGLGVSASVPGTGTIVSTPPANYVIYFSVAADPASVQAGDFTVDGVAASAVNLSADSKTATFTFVANPLTAQGPHTMQIAAGAIAAVGNPVTTFMPFTGKFFYDAVPLQIIATNPPPGGTFTLPGPFNYDVVFNEAVNPLTVQASDLVLGGATVLDVNLINGSTTARFTIHASGEGKFTANIAAGAVSDTFGNPIGTPFSASYSLDSVTTPFPTPLTPKLPFGSLVYDGSTSGTISSGDTDNFTLAVDAGQTLTVLVTASAPGFQPTAAVRDPSNVILGAIDAPAPGKPALLQTIATTTTGVYTIIVGGGSSTVGDYTVQVTLNGGLEIEQQLNESTNDSRGTAQDLDSSLAPLESPATIAQSVTILGGNAPGSLAPAIAFDFESGTNGFVTNNAPSPGSAPGLWHYSTGRGAQPGHSATRSFYYGQGEGPSGGGNYETGSQRNKGSLTSPAVLIPAGATLNFNYLLQTEKVTYGDQATVLVSSDGFISAKVVASNSTNLAERNSWAPVVPIDLASFAGQSVQIRWVFDTVDEIFNNFEGWYIDDVQITVPSIWNDYYSLSLGAGESVTAALKQLSGSGATVALEDSSGAVLASGLAGATNVDRFTSMFTATTAGAYYIRATGNLATTYSLVITKNAAFDIESNDTFSTAESIAGVPGVLGAIAATDLSPDWYAFDVVSTANAVRLQTSTRADGFGQFTNVLNPKLELFSPSNILVASGVVLADSRNEAIEFQPLVTGTYRTRLTAENGTTGEYFLAKSFAPVVSSFTTIPAINENDSDTVSGTINDPDVLESHTVVIAWGPGEGTTVVNLAPGVLMFNASHRYLDDNPSGTGSNVYPIGVTVTDNHGGSGTASSSVTVNNTPPSLIGLAASSVTEGSATTLTGTIADAGTLDTFTLVIDWGNGTQTLNNIAAGPLNITHPYVDDNATDSYPISVSVTDDDGANVSAATTVSVSNVAPTAALGLLDPIVEGGTATLAGSISDPGILDAFTLTIDWGDPLSPNNTEIINLKNPPADVTWDPKTLKFTAAHQYLDDPSGAADDRFQIRLTVNDDDAGTNNATANVSVGNVAPVPTFVSVSAPQQEGSEIKVEGAATDAASDHDTLTFGWQVFKNASAAAFASGAGTTAFAFTPDNDGSYRVELTVADEDGGSSVIDQTIVVADVAPQASNRDVATDEDSHVDVTLVATDVPNDSLSYAIATPPLHGKLSGAGPLLTYTPAGDYFGPDSFTYRASDGQLSSATATVSINVASVNDAPVAGSGSFSTAEDIPLSVAGGGLLSHVNDVDHDTLTASLVDDAAHGHIAFSADGAFTYQPAGDYNGPDSFTYRVDDGKAKSNLATVLLNVVPVNDLPSFTKGDNQDVTDEHQAVTISGWATNLKSGPADESSQSLSIVVTTDNDALFLIPPTVDLAGKLSFTPRPNVRGAAQVTVKLRDDGGPGPDGVESSVTQVFTIDVAKPRPWHNTRSPFDVDDNNQVAPIDALAIINYLNSLPPNTRVVVPPTAAIGKPVGYLDTSGENEIAPLDALLVINNLNSSKAAGEGEGTASAGGQDVALNPMVQNPPGSALADIIALLALDVAEQGKRRRSAH